MARAEKNTFKLPQGQPIAAAMRRAFREQHRQILGALSRKKAGPELPDAWPEFRLGNLALSERMTPLFEAIWDKGGRAFVVRNELDPDAWEVRNPEVQTAIEQAALTFAESTNKTTSLELDDALRRTRSELIEGVYNQGESVRELTKRVNAIFDKATKGRARMIAASEAARAYHAGAEAAAIRSGVVLGWEWLISEDACPLCQTVGRRAKFVRLGQPFAINGNHPVYSEVRFPPLHPSCQCSVREIVDQSDLPPELRDPEPAWAPTLTQPKPEPEDMPPPPPEPEAKAGPRTRSQRKAQVKP